MCRTKFRTYSVAWLKKFLAFCFLPQTLWFGFYKKTIFYKRFFCALSDNLEPFSMIYAASTIQSHQNTLVSPHVSLVLAFGLEDELRLAAGEAQH